jgi:hypothetical protein
MNKVRIRVRKPRPAEKTKELPPLKPTIRPY